MILIKQSKIKKKSPNSRGGKEQKMQSNKSIYFFQLAFVCYHINAYIRQGPHINGK